MESVTANFIDYLKTGVSLGTFHGISTDEGISLFTNPAAISYLRDITPFSYRLILDFRKISGKTFETFDHWYFRAVGKFLSVSHLLHEALLGMRSVLF